MAFTSDLVGTALRERTGAGGELRADGCVTLDPVGERVFAVLDDAVRKLR